MYFSAGCVAATIEILTNSVNEWNIEVAQKKYISDWDYSANQEDGLAVYLSWLVAVVYVIAGIVFIIASGKHKGSRAATAEFEIEDRPVHIGR